MDGSEHRVGAVAIAVSAACSGAGLDGDDGAACDQPPSVGDGAEHQRVGERLGAADRVPLAEAVVRSLPDGERPAGRVRADRGVGSERCEMGRNTSIVITS